MDRFTLFSHFANGDEVHFFYRGKRYRGFIASIEREDGSGFCFNVRIRVGMEYLTVFVRCNSSFPLPEGWLN